MEFMLNQFPRDSCHVSRLPCKDVSIFLEEFDEHEFLFGIQGVAYVSNLGRFLYKQQYLLAECVLRFNGHFGGLGVGHDWVWGWGGARPRPLSAPRVLWMLSAFSHLTALLVTVIGSLDISPNGDDSMQSWHL
jgi:hypothetical protein